QDHLEVREESGGRSISKLNVFCGRTLPLPLMSSGSSLTLIFKSYTSAKHVTGFLATYRFTTDFGLNSGTQLIEEHPCTFIFNSSEHLIGEFYSPNPGGMYPRNTECNYIFQGMDNQKVRINFHYFDMEGVMPCTEATASDYLEFSNW
ncbi:unnamed protein product, partial [Meganyctiphanes norvegica]